MSSEPTNEEWLKLYDAASKFKAIEAWDWMYDDYIFGVQNPEDGEIGYCSVLGTFGEIFGLIVYMGQDGLESYLTIMSNPEDINDHLYIQDCISATFEDRKFIWKDIHLLLDTAKKEKSISIRVNDIRVAGIKKNSVKSKGKWEIDFFINPTMPIKEKDRPYFPLLTLIVDSLSGHVFNVHLTEPSNYYQRIFDSFVEFIEKTGVMPQEIFVEKDELQTILHPATVALGIKLTKIKKCRMVKEAQNGLLEFGRRMRQLA